MNKVISKFIGFSVARYKLIVGLAVLLTIGAGVLAAGLTVDTGMDDMLPEDNAIVRAASAMEQEFGAQDNVFVVIKGDAQAAKSFMDALSARLQEENLVNNVFFQVDRQAFAPYAPLYLDTGLFQHLQAELASPESSLSNFLDEPAMGTLVNLTISRMDQTDPVESQQLIDTWSAVVIPGESEPTISQTEVLLAKLLMNSAIPKTSDDVGLLSSDDGQLHMMVLKPKISMQDFALDRERFFTGLQDALHAVSTEHSGVVAGFTGGSFVQDYEADKVAFEDFLSTALLTLGLIMLLVAISFRRLLVPLASGLPLIMGTLLTSAFTVLIYGSINLFSISFAALLLGLGIDFAIHILARYQEERLKGVSVEAALCTTLTQTGSGMVIGALTTAVAFASFVLAKFQAFTQMGVISAVGVLMALGAMLLVMPAIIAWGDARRQRAARQGAEFTFLHPIGNFTVRRRWIAPAAVLLVALLVSGNVAGSRISTNMRELYPAEMHSLQWLDVMQAGFEYNPDTISLMADDMEQLQSRVEALEALPSVDKVESVLNYLPTDQEFKLEVLKAIGSRLEQGATQLMTIQQQLAQLPPTALPMLAAQTADDLQRLSQAAIAAGVDPSTPGLQQLRSYASRLRSKTGPVSLGELQTHLLATFSQTESLGALVPMTVQELPADVLANYQGKTGKLLIEVAPRYDIWQDANLRKFREEVSAVASENLSGMPLIMQEIVTMVKEDVLRVSIIAAAVILTMLVIGFRSIREALLAMTPVSITLLLTLGIGPALGIGLNIINLMTLPLIIGIGVDNGVHITHRLRDSGMAALPDVLVHTGKAVTMTTITTMIGFGSLIFTNHPGLSSVGKVIVLGLSICLLLTIMLLPSLHAIFIQKNANHSVAKQQQA